MLSKAVRTVCAALCALVLFLTALPLAAFAAGGIQSVGYVAQDASGSPTVSVKAGDTVSFAVSFTDSGITTDKVTADQIDPSHLSDSFSGGTVSAVVTSVGSDPLRFEVRVTGASYAGSGQLLRLRVGYKGDASSYKSFDLTVTEAVSTSAPTATPPSSEPLPAPAVIVSRSDIAVPLEPGRELELTVSFQNLGSMALLTPVASFSPSDGLQIVGGASSFALSDIPAGQTGSVKVRVRANAAITDPNQLLTAELRFNYHNGVSLVQGSANDKLTVPCQASVSGPQPVVIVSRSRVDAPIAAGQSANVTLTFQNAGSTSLLSPVVTVSPSESLYILNDSTSFRLPDIAPGQSASIVVSVRGAKEISSPSQSLSTELRFNYQNGAALAQGSSSDRVTIPAQTKESVAAPVVEISRADVPGPITAGQNVEVTLYFKNIGRTALLTPVAVVTPTEGLILLNKTASFVLKDLAPGQTASIVVRLKAAKEISSPAQSLGVELRYSYDNAGTLTQGTASDKVNLLATATSGAGASPDASVPNVIIRGFEYGGASVAAGSRFTLKFTFENTGKLKIGNVVVIVDGGESFTMDGSSNTFFYDSLGAGEQVTQEVPMQTLATAKTGAQTIGVTFKYDYVDNQKRAAATSEIKISIPVFQPDRFQVNAPAVPAAATVGEEMALTLAYVNKGKGDIANVEATVVGENVDTPARTQYLGNVVAGASGNIGFVVTPNAAGVVNFTLKISYEDGDQHVQTREFPVELTVNEYVESTDLPIDGGEAGWEEPQSGTSVWVWIVIGAAVAAGAVVTLAVVKKKKAHAAQTAADANWTDWDVPSTQPPEGVEQPVNTDSDRKGE